jgi:hypothetical protein
MFSAVLLTRSCLLADAAAVLTSPSLLSAIVLVLDDLTAEAL